MKTSKTKKSSPTVKSAKTKIVKMKDLEPSGSVKGGWTFKTFGGGSSLSPTQNAPQ